jgi:hypothetical protein
MTPAQVRGLLGKPKEEVVFGAKSLWTYPAYTVVFEGGKVVEVKFYAGRSSTTRSVTFGPTSMTPTPAPADKTLQRVIGSGAAWP